MLKSLILYLYYSIKSDPKMMKHRLFKTFFFLPSITVYFTEVVKMLLSENFEL